MASTQSNREYLTLCFTIQSSTKYLKQLFRKKDTIEGIVIGSSNRNSLENSTSLTIYEVFRFYLQNKSGFTITKADTGSKDDIRSSVIRLHLKLYAEQIEMVKKSIDEIKNSIASTENFIGDHTALVLESLFSYVLDNKAKFNEYLNSKFIPNPVRPNEQCLICSDEAETVYCEASICFKCKYFFQSLMKRRTLLSLRCSKNGSCFTKTDVELSCRKCRFDKCRLANMVEKYCYSELPEQIIKSCLVCRKSDENNRPVMGYSLCADCRIAFDELLGTKEDPECLQEPECRCATFECRKCLKDKFNQYGVFQTYLMKVSNTKRPLQCWIDNQCTVCCRDLTNYLPENKIWMDLQLCAVCRSFLINSLENDTHILYCCPNGEIGRLCSISMGQMCSYCWFVRCELEGLIERWQIADGNSDKWKEIISLIEYNTSSDDDE